MSDQPQEPIEPAAPQEREWVAVAPQNPYVTTPGGSSTGPTGKGLAIGAMALGLASLFTALVGVFFSALIGGVIAVSLGLIALVLGIIALIKRQNPRAATLTGVVTGLLGVIFGIASAAWFLSMMLTGPIPADEALNDTPDDGAWSSEEQPQQLLEWPSNMATGGILFGPGAVPVESAPVEPGSAPIPNTVNRDGDVADILIYVDYSCSHCKDFEQANTDLLTSALESGEATVEIVPLTFLDRASDGAYYSSRASAAMACIVDSQPEVAWAAHNALLSPELQPAGTIAPTNDELIASLNAHTAGLNGGVEACISEERFVPFAQALNNWVFTTTVPNAIDESLSVSGTPFVLVNGELYTGAPADAAAFTSFFHEMTGG